MKQFLLFSMAVMLAGLTANLSDAKSNRSNSHNHPGQHEKHGETKKHREYYHKEHGRRLEEDRRKGTGVWGKGNVKPQHREGYWQQHRQGYWRYGYWPRLGSGVVLFFAAVVDCDELLSDTNRENNIEVLGPFEIPVVEKIRP